MKKYKGFEGPLPLLQIPVMIPIILSAVTGSTIRASTRPARARKSVQKIFLRCPFLPNAPGSGKPQEVRFKKKMNSQEFFDSATVSTQVPTFVRIASSARTGPGSSCG
jgi:hypothetical protein